MTETMVLIVLVGVVALVLVVLAFFGSRGDKYKQTETNTQIQNLHERLVIAREWNARIEQRVELLEQSHGKLLNILAAKEREGCT